MSTLQKILDEVKGLESKCGCGVKVTGMPPLNLCKIFATGDELQGIYWNCLCNSTHFIPLKTDLTDLKVSA